MQRWREILRRWHQRLLLLLAKKWQAASLSTVIDKNQQPAILTANLVATIQQELLELRGPVAAHVDANPHELLPQTANENRNFAL